MNTMAKQRMSNQGGNWNVRLLTILKAEEFNQVGLIAARPEDCAVPAALDYERRLVEFEKQVEEKAYATT